jgi:hypothetical protein
VRDSVRAPRLDKKQVTADTLKIQEGDKVILRIRYGS